MSFLVGSFVVISDAERRKSLGRYLARVIDALNLNMENKSRSYEHPPLASLFLLNNYHFIHKTFTRYRSQFFLPSLPPPPLPPPLPLPFLPSPSPSSSTPSPLSPPLPLPFHRHDQMQGLLEEAYDQIENDYITKIQNQMGTYQRWYDGYTSASSLF